MTSSTVQPAVQPTAPSSVSSSLPSSSTSAVLPTSPERAGLRGIILALAWVGLATALAVATAIGEFSPLVGAALLALTVAAIALTSIRTRATATAGDDRATLALAVGGDGTWDYDLRRGAVTYDARCGSMLGYPPGEIDSHLGAWGKLVHPDDLEGAREALDDFVAGRRDVYEVHVRLRDAAGRWQRVLDRAEVAARDEAGAPVRVVGIHRLLGPEPPLATAAAPQIGDQRSEDALRDAARLLASDAFSALRRVERLAGPEVKGPARALAERLKRWQRTQLAASTPPHAVSLPELLADAAHGESTDAGPGLSLRGADRLSDAWGHPMVIREALAFLFDELRDRLPPKTELAVRRIDARSADRVAFSLGLPWGVSVEPGSLPLRAAQALMRAASGRMRLRESRIDIELPRPPGPPT